VVPWLAGAALFGWFLWALSDQPLTFPFVACALVEIAFAYLTLAHLFNRTRVVVDGETIEVSHGPIPWPGGKKTELARLAQIFVHREVYGSTKKSRTVEFRVRAKTVGGDDVLLVNGPMHPDRALAIEATLEAYLRIEDEPVPGEVRRR